jgi:hypothetical protein
MANSINVNQNNNNVSLQDANGKVIITDDKLGVNIEVTQPVTNIVTVSSLGPQGQAGVVQDTGSLLLTSSFNAFTASYYIDSASFDTNILNNSSSIALLSGSFETFSGSYNTGSFTGSFYGDGSNLTGIVSSKWTGSNPITREGNVEITGSLIISGSSTFINIGPAIFSGSVTGINGFTGSLLGTAESASYVLNAESASYALTASYAANVPLTASYALNAESASYALTASYIEIAQTASYVENAQTASFVILAQTASYIETAQTASYYNETDPVFTAVSGTFVLTSSFDQFTSSYNTGSFTGSFTGDGSQLTGIVSSKWTGSNPISRDGNVEITGSLNVTNGITASLYGTASWAENSLTASYITLAQTASYVENAQTASYVLQATSASYANTASYVENAQTASYVLNAISSSYSPNALSASYSVTASYVNPLYQQVLISGSLNLDGPFTITGSIESPTSITFDTAATDADAIARLKWNETEGTLDLGMGGGLATLQMGQELYYPKVVNKSGEDLINGTLVMVDPGQPAQGNRLRVIRAITDGTYPSELIVGPLTEDVDDNQEGFATWFGYVRNLNRTDLENNGIKDPTDTWGEGSILYTNPNLDGGYTSSMQASPFGKSSIAVVTAVNGQNITLLVRPKLDTNVGNLHDVTDLTTTSSYGDLFIKSGNIWTTGKTLSGSYSVSGSLTAIEISGSFSGSFFGDGSGLTGVGGDPFPYTGSAIVSGSLQVTGSIYTDSTIYSPFTIALNFETPTTYIYKTPHSFRADSVESDPSASIEIIYQASGSSEVTSSYSFGSTVNKFDKLIVTPSSASLVILNSIRI